MKKLIVHLPAWFPVEYSAFSGIFIKKQIEAINEFDKNEHIVLFWHDTVNATLKQPFSFIKSFINLLKKDVIYVEGTIVYYKFHYFQSYEILFGSNELRLSKRIKKIILNLQTKNKVNLIHAHITFPCGYIAEKINSEMMIPYIISEHMGPFPFEQLKKDLEIKIVSPIRNSCKIIAVSNNQAAEIYKYTKVEAKVIPNVIDETEFKLLELNESSSIFQFLMIGLLTEVKGVDILLHAVKILAGRNRTNFVVRIGGQGPIVNSLKKLMLELQIENYIDWLGEISRENILETYSKCDSFVCSSRHESFGVAVVEALACGKPVVATKCGGPEDTINEINGILVEKEDAISLAMGMEWMIDHFNQYDANKIREDYLSKYSREVIASKYQNVYNGVS